VHLADEAALFTLLLVHHAVRWKLRTHEPGLTRARCREEAVRAGACSESVVTAA
jgi:hypothetical protein